MFTDPAFHDLNDVPPDRRWRHEHVRDGRLVGVLDGVVSDGVLLSGYSAPFGGPDVARADLLVDDAVALLSGAVAAARADGIRELRVRCRPPVYSAAEPLLEYAWWHVGATVVHCDLNQHVDLRPLHAGADPLSLLADRKRRYVRAALGQGHDLVEVSTEEELQTLHGILAANRAAHGRPAPLPPEYLAQVASTWPDRVRLLLLRQEGRPTAAAVVYRVLSDIDVVVHWADSGDPTASSPMELLAHLVTVDSASSGARLLDLGPSTEKDGTPNGGLVAFKRSIGALPGTRKVLGVDLTVADQV